MERLANQDWADRLAGAMHRADLSVRRLAEALRQEGWSVPKTEVALWVSAGLLPPDGPALLPALARALDTPVWELIPCAEATRPLRKERGK